jgi:hypothetical protein
MTDQGRMSTRPNIQASKHFFSNHNKYMTRAQMATFFAGNLRLCLVAKDFATLKLFQKWMLSWIDEEELDVLTRICCKWPRLGHLVLRSRERLRLGSNKLKSTLRSRNSPTLIS